MSSERLRKIVEQIQKTAEVPGRSKGEKVPATSTPATPTAAPTAASPKPGQSTVPQRGGQKPVAPGVGGNPTSPVIKQMQLAMQNLAKLISNTIDYNGLQNALQGKPGATKEDFDASYGRDAFSNFMVNRYLRNSNTKGVEYDTDPNKKKMDQKNPSDLKNMFIVLDGLKRIGPGSKEFIADGAWGPRTNNGLKNIAAIADALMKLGKDLGMESSSFDPNKLSALTPLIPDDPKSISFQEKAERAPKITELLNGIQSLFKEFKEQVLTNPHYKDFIINKKPLFTITPTDAQGNPVFAGGEKAIYDKIVSKAPGYATPLGNVTINSQFTGGKNIQPLQFTGADLVDQRAFTAALMRSKELQAIQQTNPETFKNIMFSALDQVQEQINNKLNAQPAPQAAPQQQVAQQPAAGQPNQPKA